MSDIRVYELAKQLGIDNKVVKQIMTENGFEAKSHMSSVPQEAVNLIMQAVNANKKDPKVGTKQQESPRKPENTKKVDANKVENTKKAVNVGVNNKHNMQSSTEEKVEKKSHISQVYNPQNSANAADNKRRSFKENKQKENNNLNNNRIDNSNNNARNKVNEQKQGNTDQDRNKKIVTNRNNSTDNQKRFSNTNQDRQNTNNQGRQNGANQNRLNNTNQNRPINNNQNRPNNNNQNRSNNSNQNHQNKQNNVNQRNDNGNAYKNNNYSKSNGNGNNNYANRTNDKGNFNKKNNMKQNTPTPAPQPKVEEIKEITLPETLTIKELADKMKLQPSALVKKLFLQGQVVTINQEIEFETAQEIALEYDIIAVEEEKVDIIEELLREDEEDEKKLVKRPPVVCVMGHVDHGKTSLLDAIRQTHVTDKEAGGITQHIGAYTVNIKGEQITFLDTPGHEAFTAMRMRGAQATDIAILVVAADDGVMPQTVEAINHAKAAGISIIVAVNKIDKPSANIEKVKQELAEYELVPEDWGGDTIFVPVSAHTKEGIDTLLEMILLEAEVCELKANPNRKARGLVIEAQLDKGRGPVATVLVQKGTLRVGDAIAAGSFYGKVRAMVNDKRMRVSTALPSTPVEILGLNGVPNAGEVFVATANDKEARNFAETFIKEGREKLLEGSKVKAKMSLDDLFNQIQEGELKELDLIVKADVQGSVEAVKQSLTKLTNEEVVVKVIHAGVGAINESDVILASASNAIIIGFNVRPDNMAKEIAEREKVDLRLYRVIYQAIADVEAAMKGMLDPVYEEKVIGHAEIRQIFKASGVGTIAGSYVLDGLFRRGCKARITREGTQIFEGELASLKRFKDDVKEVKANYECGLVFEKFNDLQEGDLVEAYVMEEVAR